MESVTSFGGLGSLFCKPRTKICLVIRRAGSFSYTRLLESVSSFVEWGVCLTRPVLETVSPFGAWGVCHTHPVMESVCSSGGWWVSSTSPVLKSVGSSFCWDVLVTRRGRSLSCTPRAGICLDVHRFRNLSRRLATEKFL